MDILSLLLSVRDVQKLVAINNYLWEELGHNTICYTTKHDSLSQRGFVRLQINYGMEFYVKLTNIHSDTSNLHQLYSMKELHPLM